MNTQIKSALISLRKARIDRGYSQVEAAEIMGLPDTIQLSRWEHGMRLPSLINALKLSAAYNSSVDSLLYGISASLRKAITKRRGEVDARKDAIRQQEKYGPVTQPSPAQGIDM